MVQSQSPPVDIPTQEFVISNFQSKESRDSSKIESEAKVQTRS